jgi:hypothetical protein
MTNVEIIEIDGVEHAIIDNGNGEFTSMFKSDYDALPEAEQSTPSLENGTIS